MAPLRFGPADRLGASPRGALRIPCKVIEVYDSLVEAVAQRILPHVESTA
jgi:hypothetical protein